MTPPQLAQAQLDAYNARDIEAFLLNYAEDCEVYHQATGELMMKGKEQMRARYGSLFKEAKNLHATLVNRMELGGYVIDQEDVIHLNDERVQAIAIYEVKDGLIARVCFIK